MLEEKLYRERIEEKRHHETTSLTAKNVNLMEENNKICRQSLHKSTVANRIAFISMIIAFCALLVAIFK